MKAYFRISFMSAALFVCILLAGCSQSPRGYDWLLERSGGAHPGFVFDPGKSAEFAADWAQDWRAPLTFFTTELHSADATRVKTGAMCLAMLAHAIEYRGANQISDDSKSQFDKAFPLAELKAVIAAHPEYDDWIAGIRQTKYATDFPKSTPRSPK